MDTVYVIFEKIQLQLDSFLCYFFFNLACPGPNRHPSFSKTGSIQYCQTRDIFLTLFLIAIPFCKRLTLLLRGPDTLSATSSYLIRARSYQVVSRYNTSFTSYDITNGKGLDTIKFPTLIILIHFARSILSYSKVSGMIFLQWFS